MMLNGHCACQHIRYRLESAPLFVHACHCTYCQRETGSAFALNALIESNRLHVLEGSTVEVLMPSESGKGQRVFCCPHCHVALWSHYAYGKLSDAITFVRVGTLVERDLVPPDIQIFSASKQAWLPLSDDIPAMPAFYRASEHWPKESIERRDALFAAQK